MQQIEIRVSGHLAHSWSDWLGGLSVQHTVDGQTILCGPVADQSALYGLIDRLSTLGLHLLSVAVRTALSATEEVGHVRDMNVSEFLPSSIQTSQTNRK
jgi:hypothetical protein